MRAMFEDFVAAWRGLRRRPAFAAAGIGLLACGLAASSTVFSFVDAVLLRPLPGIADTDRLVRIQERVANPTAGQSPWRNVIPTDMEHIAASAPSLASTAAMLDGGAIPLSTDEGASRIPVVHATGGFFDVVGVRPALGRPFTREDERSGAEPVAVLSHAAWQRLFDGRADVLGTRMVLNHQAHTVIGVMPSGFVFPDGPDVYLPLPQSAFTNRFHVAAGLARVRPGVAIERVTAEVDAAVAALARDDPGGGHGEGARVLTWRASVTERVRPAMRILTVAAALVLALATANLGGLLAHRTTARMRELSVRRSLGATTGRVARLLLAEGVLLGLGGALLGAVCTALTLQTVVALSPADLPFRDAVRLDVRVLGVTAALAALAGVVAGLVPALRVRRSPLVVTDRSEGAAGSARGSRLLVAAQIAVAMVLVTSAGLLTRSFVTALRVDPGVRTDGILTARVQLPRSRYADEQRQRAFFLAALDSMRAVPGVVAAEVSMFAPLRGTLPTQVSRDAPGGATQTVFLNSVSPGLLRMLSVPLLQGRGLEAGDHETAERVALVSRQAAAMLFPGESPLDRVIHRGEEGYRVVGVVGDIRQEGPLEDPRPAVYVTVQQFPWSGGTFSIATHGDPIALTQSLRAVVRRMDPELPFDRIEALGSVVDESLAQPRFYALTVGVFGALALALAVSGLYAVVAFAARRRMFEFGVRCALGAQPVDNLWLVFRQGLVLSLAGVGVGSILAVQAMLLLRSLLYRTDPGDPVMLIVAGALTLLVALLAALAPAMRAARVDPVIALRSD